MIKLITKTIKMKTYIRIRNETIEKIEEMGRNQKSPEKETGRRRSEEREKVRERKEEIRIGKWITKENNKSLRLRLKNYYFF